MAFKDLYENAKKQGADTATLKKIDEDARKVTGVGVTDRVVPKVTTTQPVVKVAASQPATSTSVSQPTVEQPSVSSEGTKDAETQNDTQNTEETKKTSKEMAEEAQKAYDDYVKSDEHKKKLEESNQKLMQEQLANQLLAGIAPDLQQPKLAADEKEQQLKAAVDYYKTKAQEEEDEVVMVTDLEELGEWVKAQVRAGNLPAFPEDCKITDIRVLPNESGYMVAQDFTQAKYMIQFQIEYILEDEDDEDDL